MICSTAYLAYDKASRSHYSLFYLVLKNSTYQAFLDIFMIFPSKILPHTQYEKIRFPDFRRPPNPFNQLLLFPLLSLLSLLLVHKIYSARHCGKYWKCKGE